jgi:hypothetical protein
VAIFLFREWVLQNMPQPLDELGGEDAAAGAPPREAARRGEDAPEAAEPAAPAAGLQDMPSPLLRAARMDDADLTNFVARVQQLSAQLEASRAGLDEAAGTDAGAEANEPARQPHDELALISALAEDEIDVAAVRAARLDRFAPRDIRPLPTRRTPNYQAALDLLEEQHSDVSAASSDAGPTPGPSSHENAEADASLRVVAEHQEITLPAVSLDKGKSRAVDEDGDRAAASDELGADGDAHQSASSSGASTPGSPAFAELEISESRELDPDVTVDPRLSPKGASNFVALNEDGHGDRWGAASTSSPRPMHQRVPVEAETADQPTSSSTAAAHAPVHAAEELATPGEPRPAELVADVHAPEAEAEEPGDEPDGDAAGENFDDFEVWGGDGEEAEEEAGGAQLEEDLEGMMEAIGMRGPLSGLAANVSLMYVLCK